MALLCGAVYFALLAQWGPFPTRLFDADFIHPHLIVRDLAHGGNLFQWSNSAALYAFPDWLFALTALLPLDSHAAALVSSILLTTGLALTGGMLINQYLALTLPQAIAVYALMLIALRTTASRVIVWLLEYGASVYIHTGATLCVMASIILARGIFGGRRPGRYAVAISIIGGAAIYSDPLYFPWFTAPLLATAIIVATLSRKVAPLLAPLCIAAIHGAVFILERIKPFPSHASELFTVDSLTAARFIGEAVVEGVTLLDLTMVLYATALPLSVALLVVSCVSLKMSGRIAPHVAQDMILGLATLSVISLPVVFGVIDHASKLRYVIALVYLVPVLLVRVIARPTTAPRLERLSRWAPALIAILAVPLAPSLFETFRVRPYNELITCLEAHSLTDGYADHDFAKPLIFLTDDVVHLAQVGHGGNTNFSNRWRGERIDGGSFQPNFVLTDKLAPEHLAQFAQPHTIIRCGSSDAWIYDTSSIVAPSR
ncbi:hypothetical protein SAMN05216456_1848 [Devosia crocina]|uniref:Uncharacterized protein n=2 Tax=Devosia crocina TaxID=429728 RepID=A0A1I7NED1_9HYPH|nr:hypothetical protein SAMN05216456_1848 [Devosia crocina]